MTKIIYFTILLFATATMSAQTFGTGATTKDYFYFKTTFDPNAAFAIMDNPRTEDDVRGLDFDFETGVRWKSVGVYIFAGAFKKINYRNYGAGFDVYFNWFSHSELTICNPITKEYFTAVKGVDLSIGANITFITRKYSGHDGAETWRASLAPAVRATSTFWFSKSIGFVLNAQLQNRPDINKLAIFEGGAGIVVRFNN